MKSKEAFWNFILNGDKNANSSSWFSGNEVLADKISLRVINNRDGSPRWVYPTNLKKPLFLNFYPIISFRSKLIRWVYSFLFYTRLIHLFSNKVDVYCTSKPYFLSWFGDNSNTYAIFAGTVGPNQKIITYHLDENNQISFSKIPYGKYSKKLIQNEYDALFYLSKLNISSFCFPNLINKNSNQLTISEVNLGESNSELTNLHLNAFKELYKFDSQPTGYLNGNLSNLQNVIKNDHPTDKSLQNLKLILNNALSLAQDSDHIIKSGFGHGDFTPWNCGINNDKLTIIDWELSNNFPLMYDTFHFIIQNEIMNSSKSTKSILDRLNLIMEKPEWVSFCSFFELDWKKQLNAYIINVSSYYYTIYCKQESIHHQAHRAMLIWTEMLEKVVTELGCTKIRNVFIPKLFNFLKDDKYALMKNRGLSIVDMKESSDLDIFIKPKTAKNAIKWIKGQPEIAKYHIENKSYMQVVSIYFKDGSFLSIDFIYKLKRRALEYLIIDPVIEFAELNREGIKVPQLEHDFEYIVCFYALNGAKIPAHYVEYFESFPENKKRQIIHFLNSELEFSAKSLNIFLNGEPKEIADQIKKHLHLKSENKGLSSLKNTLFYLKDTVKKFIKGNGFVISFSGVDGAGKSTVISHIKQSLENRFRKKVVVLRHRPSILPILSSFVHGKKKAEQKAADTLPRQGKNSSKISSLFRFSYYLSDFLIGQFVIWFRYTLRGYVVLYDRYYFDFIEDPKRSNITLPKWYRKLFYRFIYKPSVNVFLHANPDLILSRKQELSKADIVQLTESYKNLFEEFNETYSEKYVAIENNELKVTIDKIENLITSAA